MARRVYHASIDTATSGDNQLVGANPSARIRVVSYTLVCSAAVSVRWRATSSISGATTNLSGAMSFAANGGAVAVGSVDTPLLETPAGSSLVLNLSGAVQVSGHYSYFYEA